MSELTEVEDPNDSRLDDFRDLSVADRRPDRPGGRGLVIAEGVVVVERLAASSYPIRALLGVRRRYDELRAVLAAEVAPFYVVTADVMAEVVGFHLNRGVLAVADRADNPPVGELLARAQTVAVLEGVGDHENLGSIFRNAAALGIDAVILAEGCSDPLYRRSIRVSMGNVFKVPFGNVEQLVPAGIDLLRSHGFVIAALTPSAEAIAIQDAGLRGRKVAVLLGAEGPGLTDTALEGSDVNVRIPMANGVDSLNVATAGAIAFAAIVG